MNPRGTAVLTALVCALCCGEAPRAAVAAPAAARAVAAATPVAGGAEDWISLFNGRDLEGWTPKLTHHALGDNYRDTFRVEDGLLKVRYDGYERFDTRFGLLFHERPLAYYRLRVEYRFTGEQAPGGPGSWAVRNSGVMLHAQPPASMTVEQNFPISIEAQFLGGLGDGKPRPTANVCTPGTEIVFGERLHPEHCLASSAETFDGDQWVVVEVEVLGGSRIRHFVNGAQVLEYGLAQVGGGMVSHHDATAKVDGALLDRGYIALQSESHPIDFRRVEVLELEGCTDPAAENYEAYYLKSNPGACRYAPIPEQQGEAE